MKTIPLRRTLMAVGIAVLASMLLAPHGGKAGIRGWGPFFSAQGFEITPSGIWYGGVGRVMIDMLALEIVFLAVLFAVVVNVHWWPKAKNRKPASTETSPDSSANSTSHSQATTKRRVLGIGLVVVLGIILISFGAVSMRERRDAVTYPAANRGEEWDRESRGQPGSPSPEPRQAVSSPYSSGANFATQARKLREDEIGQIPPLNEPTTLHPAIATQRYPWKTNIVTTIFWIGERGNRGSVWNPNWTNDYGGVDDPDPSTRHSYLPANFTRRQNPFYCALPYNDVTEAKFKPEAPLVIPWFKQTYAGPGQSVCWHRWLAIRKGNRTCYAQWEDCGPFLTDHFQYVFGNERPKPNSNHGAGLNVSPAVRDYLGLATTDMTDWQFVEVRDVPPGPWRDYGENNHFVIARRQNEQRMMEHQQQSGENVKK